MTPRELELYIERLKRAQEMIETNDIGQFQEKIMEVKSWKSRSCLPPEGKFYCPLVAKYDCPFKTK